MVQRQADKACYRPQLICSIFVSVQTQPSLPKIHPGFQRLIVSRSKWNTEIIKSSVLLFYPYDTSLETMILQMNDLKSKNMVHCRRAGIGNEQWKMCSFFSELGKVNVPTTNSEQVTWEKSLKGIQQANMDRRKHIKYMAFFRPKVLKGYFLQSNFYFREICLLWLNHLHLDNINTPHQSTAGVAFGTECHS